MLAHTHSSISATLCEAWIVLRYVCMCERQGAVPNQQLDPKVPGARGIRRTSRWDIPSSLSVLCIGGAVQHEGSALGVGEGGQALDRTQYGNARAWHLLSEAHSGKTLDVV